MAKTMTSDERKKDTREKIELGGLIVKAGLRYEKRALLLGALVDLSRKLHADEGERARLIAIGTEPSAMAANKLAFVSVPVVLMVMAVVGMSGIEQWLAEFAKTEAARLTLGRIGIAAPYVVSATIGTVLLFTSAGSANIKYAAWGALAGSTATLLIAAIREETRLATVADRVPATKSMTAALGQTIWRYAHHRQPTNSQRDLKRTFERRDRQELVARVEVIGAGKEVRRRNATG